MPCEKCFPSHVEEKLAVSPTWMCSSCSQMAAHGYEGQPVLTDSSEFGLPARRRRLYVFLVRVEADPLLSFQDRSVDSIFSAFGGLLSGCVRQGPCASEVLLADDDPAVLADLTHRMQRREELSQHEKPSTTEWADHHMKMAESLRVRWGQGAQPNVSNNSWYKTLTDREQDALPLLQVQSSGSLMRDLSQSINRANAFTWKAEAGKHIAPTMLPKVNLWLEPVPPRNAARLMLGREALLYSRDFQRCCFWNAWILVKLKRRPLAWLPKLRSSQIPSRL